jgi:hypothetical protein
MCILQMYVQCYDLFLEVLPEEAENAELIVEHLVSQVLLDLFDGGTVDDVTICFSPGLRMGLYHCTIQIRAQCSYQSFVLLPRTQENMQFTVQKRICSMLKELFGSVHVDSTTFSLTSSDEKTDPAASQRGF